jgi:hypothetical protein
VDSWKKALLGVAWSGIFVIGIEGQPALAQEASGAGQRESLTARPVLTAEAAKPGSSASELPDSPGATLANAEAKQQNTPQQPPVSTTSSSTQTAPSSGVYAQSASQTPAGTAVAESPNASGIAASQPAGVAIAPAKQRRVRTIVLRMGAIVGAGVAVGSVVALTAATSSKPPGAH